MTIHFQLHLLFYLWYTLHMKLRLVYFHAMKERPSTRDVPCMIFKAKDVWKFISVVGVQLKFGHEILSSRSFHYIYFSYALNEYIIIFHSAFIFHGKYQILKKCKFNCRIFINEKGNKYMWWRQNNQNIYFHRKITLSKAFYSHKYVIQGVPNFCFPIVNS